MQCLTRDHGSWHGGLHFRPGRSVTLALPVRLVANRRRHKLLSDGGAAQRAAPPISGVRLLACAESGGFFGSACGVALAVGMGACAGKRAALHNQVLVTNRATLEPALENLPDAGRVAGLR